MGNTVTACALNDYRCQAKTGGLRYVTDSMPGYRRKKAGKHFAFYNSKGQRITDEAEISRIRKLAIPPAYRDVWICPHANGHIQATGIDARGRKQYRYHAEWRNVRDATKFNHILEFGEALPTIRAAIGKHLAKQGMPREKVLAAIISLLEKTLIRVGNSEYAASNGSYGLTTLRDKHVDVSGSTIRFHFKGKSGKEWNLKLNDRRIARIIRACSDLEGQELFAYQDEEGNVRDVTSTDVNRYLQEITGAAFTAKDFRTWTGTVLAAIALEEYERYDSEAQAKRNITAAIEQVASKLGNTPTICRKCYVHPEILNAYLDGDLKGIIQRDITDTVRKTYGTLSNEEILVLAFLKKRLAA